jgi:hypothetical protein
MKFLFFVFGSALLAAWLSMFHVLAADCPDKGSRECFPADTVGGAVEGDDNNYRRTGR